jgi:hypothetical protein
MKERPRTQKVVVGVEALGGLALGTLDLSLFERRRDGTHDAFGHLVLQIEDIVKRTLEAVCPEMHSG